MIVIEDSKRCKTKGCDNRVLQGTKCPSCLYKQFNKRTGRHILNRYDFDKTSLRKAIRKADSKVETADKLYKKCLMVWSQIVRGSDATVKCSTCNNTIPTRAGLWGAHAGHYLDKSNHWKLALEVFNGLPQCKNCNCDYIYNPRRIELIKIEMRSAMVDKYGRDKVDYIDKLGDVFRKKVKRGEENRKPLTNDKLAHIYGREEDIIWLKKKYTELKLALESTK